MDSDQVAASLHALPELGDHAEVRQLLVVLARRVSECKTEFNSQQIGDALYGLKGLGDGQHVRIMIAALCVKIEASSADIGGRNLGNALYGLHAVGDSSEVRALLGSLVRKFHRSAEALDALAFSNCLFGVQCIGDVPETRALLALLADRFGRSADEIIYSQTLGHSLYGLRKMRDSAEVHMVIETISRKLAASLVELDGQAIGNALYGLQGQSDLPAVQKLLRELTPRVAQSSANMDGGSIGSALHGLQTIGGESDAARGILLALAIRIARSSAELSAREIGDALYGLKRMSDSSEVRTLLSALTPKISASNGLFETYHINNALLGLQSLSDCREVQELLSVLTQKILASKAELDSQTIGNSLCSLRNFGDTAVVRGLLDALIPKIRVSSAELTSHDLANAFLGMRILADSAQSRQLLLVFGAKLAQHRAEFDAQAITSALLGLQSLTTTIESRKVLALLAARIRACNSEFVTMQIVWSIYGLRMQSDAAEVRTIIQALDYKIRKSRADVDSEALERILEGLLGLGDSDEAQSILEGVLLKFKMCMRKGKSRSLCKVMQSATRVGPRFDQIILQLCAHELRTSSEEISAEDISGVLSTLGRVSDGFGLHEGLAAFAAKIEASAAQLMSAQLATIMRGVKHLRDSAGARSVVYALASRIQSAAQLEMDLTGEAIRDTLHGLQNIGTSKESKFFLSAMAPKVLKSRAGLTVEQVTGALLGLAGQVDSEEVRLLLGTLLPKLRSCEGSWDTHLIVNVVVGLQAIRQTPEGVLAFLALAQKIDGSVKSLDYVQGSALIQQLQSITDVDAVRELLRVVAAKLAPRSDSNSTMPARNESYSTDLNYGANVAAMGRLAAQISAGSVVLTPQAMGDVLSSLNGIPESTARTDLVRSVAARLDHVEGHFTPQVISRALYGLQELVPNKEAHDLLNGLLRRIMVCQTLFDGKQLTSCFYGLKSLTDNEQRRQFVAALVGKFRRDSHPLSADDISELLYSCQHIPASAEAAELLQQLTLQIAGGSAEFEAQHIYSLYGIKHFVGSTEAQAVLTAIAAKCNTTSRTLTPQQLCSALLALSNIGDCTAVRRILAVLNDRLSASQIDFDALTIGDCVDSLNLLGGCQEARSVLRALVTKVETSSSFFDAQAIGKCISGLQGAGDCTEVKLFLSALAGKLRHMPPHAMALDASTTEEILYGMQFLGHSQEAHLFLDQFSISFERQSLTLSSEHISQCLIGIHLFPSHRLTTTIRGMLVNVPSSVIEKPVIMTIVQAYSLMGLVSHIPRNISSMYEHYFNILNGAIVSELDKRLHENIRLLPWAAGLLFNQIIGGFELKLVSVERKLNVEIETDMLHNPNHNRMLLTHQFRDAFLLRDFGIRTVRISAQNTSIDSVIRKISETFAPNPPPMQMQGIQGQQHRQLQAPQVQRSVAQIWDSGRGSEVGDREQHDGWGMHHTQAFGGSLHPWGESRNQQPPHHQHHHHHHQQQQQQQQQQFQALHQQQQHEEQSSWPSGVTGAGYQQALPQAGSSTLGVSSTFTSWNALAGGLPTVPTSSFSSSAADLDGMAQASVLQGSFLMSASKVVGAGAADAKSADPWAAPLAGTDSIWGSGLQQHQRDLSGGFIPITQVDFNKEQHNVDGIALGTPSATGSAFDETETWEPRTEPNAGADSQDGQEDHDADWACRSCGAELIEGLECGCGYKQKWCFDFWKGTCERGAACRFLHEHPDQSLSVCHDFQHGKCRRGDRCRFAHDLEYRRTGDWDCPSCGHVVFASKDKCRCGTGRSSVPKPSAPATSETDASDARSSPTPQQSQRREGDWDCPACLRLVYGSKTKCKCGASKSSERSICLEFQNGKCNRGNACRFSHAVEVNTVCLDFMNGKCARGSQCRFSHANVPDSNAGPNASSPSTRRPGDWDCPACGDVVFASKDRCGNRGCGASRPDVAKPGHDLGTPVTHRRSLRAHCAAVRTHAACAGKADRRLRDWDCPACGNVNFGWRDRCNNKGCGASRTGM